MSHVFLFFNHGLVIGKHFSLVSLLLAGKLLGEEAVHMLANGCALIGKHTYTCVYLLQGREIISNFANAQRSLITCKHKNTKEKSSTRFEPHGFIIRKTICMHSFCTICFSCIDISRLAGGRMYRWCMVHHCFTMHDAENIIYDVTCLSFFQSRLSDRKIFFPGFIIISWKMLGEEAVHMLANGCAIIGKYTYTCVHLLQGKEMISNFANAQRLVITCKHKDTKKKLPKTNAAILGNKRRKHKRSIGCFCDTCTYFVLCWIYDPIG